MGYRRILTVVNEHTASTVIARYAVAMVLACKASLILYSAHEKGADETILRHTDRHLDHLNAVALELEVPVTRITEVGDICRLLPKRALVEKADLVFYPLLPDERYGASFRSHPVHRLLRTVRSDLAIMRAITMAKPHPRHILMPLRGIVGDTERRLLFIAVLAGSFHAQVTLLHLSAQKNLQGMPDQITRFREQLQQHQVSGQAVDLGTDMLPALALGSEKPVADIMQRPPRPKEEHLLTRGVLLRAYIYLGLGRPVPVWPPTSMSCMSVAGAGPSRWLRIRPSICRPQQPVWPESS